MFIGDNANVARVMGIDVVATRIKLFTLMGVIAAFAGLLLTLEINVFYPTQGGGFLLPTMAAVFIGGTSIAGGLGSMFGTLFGAYIIGSLEAGIVATTISGYWVQLVEGDRHGCLYGAQYRRGGRTHRQVLQPDPALVHTCARKTLGMKSPQKDEPVSR